MKDVSKEIGAYISGCYSLPIGKWPIFMRNSDYREFRKWKLEMHDGVDVDAELEKAYQESLKS